jgi:hypothetical protein
MNWSSQTCKPQEENEQDQVVSPEFFFHVLCEGL